MPSTLPGASATTVCRSLAPDLPYTVTELRPLRAVVVAVESRSSASALIDATFIDVDGGMKPAGGLKPGCNPRDTRLGLGPYIQSPTMTSVTPDQLAVRQPPAIWPLALGEGPARDLAPRHGRHSSAPPTGRMVIGPRSALGTTYEVLVVSAIGGSGLGTEVRQASWTR